MAAAVVKWRRIKSTSYKVSSAGDVWSDISCKLLKPGLTKAGYLTVALRIDGRSITHYVHKLVAQAFIPNPKNKRTVNHKKEPKTNNLKSNLEWATYGENHAHAYKYLGREAAASIPVINGEGQRFKSSAEAARHVQRTTSAVVQAVRRGSMCAGYFWWRA